MPAVNAPVTGSIWKIEVQVGEKVEEGDELVILESMKMEIPVESEVSGTVLAILRAEGDSVTEGDPLVEVE